MDYSKTKAELTDIITLLDRWEGAESIAKIEKELALSRIREVYNSLLALPVGAEVVLAEERIKALCRSQDPAEQEGLMAENVAARVAEAVLAAQDDEPQDVLQPEPQLEAEPAPEPSPEPSPEPTPEPKVALTLQDLSEMDARFAVELFDADVDKYVSQTKLMLAMPTLDEVLVHISESFGWSASSDLAQQYVDQFIKRHTS